MIPRNMKAYLNDHLPEPLIQRRLIRDKGKCFLELGSTDEDLLSQLGISFDGLGPRLVSTMWDEESALEIGGYLVVDNLSMGRPSMGGIRMLPDISPLDIHNLARGMTLKNAAANLPYGGGKSGIVAERGLAPKEHKEVVRGFARCLRRYRDIYVPGPDVGTNDADMKMIAIENGLDCAVSKPYDMGGNRIDELGAAAGGVVTALQTLLEIAPRLRVLPQFSDLKIPTPQNLTVLIQGFGAVGAHAARILKEKLPEAKIIGISDLEGCLHNPMGLPIDTLFEMWQKKGLVTDSFQRMCAASQGQIRGTKFSTDPNDLLRESAFCVIPAAPVSKYLCVLPSEAASMNVSCMGEWSLIVEGANTYSPDPKQKAARISVEEMVYHKKGVIIANDFLVNSGGVIFAAQEHLIKTPDHLKFPEGMLGDVEAIDVWLKGHSAEFSELSEIRLEAGETYREEVIRNNMIELVDLLASDANLLPCAAAERISLGRLAAKENSNNAKAVMMPILSIPLDATLREAAALIAEKFPSIIGVLNSEGKIVGVVTAWDITRAVVQRVHEEAKVETIMSKNIISASPSDSISDILFKLKENNISAMPVVEDATVLGMIDSDLMIHRYLPKHLISEKGG